MGGAASSVEQTIKSVEIPNPNAARGESSIHRHPKAQEKLFATFADDVTTLFENFEKTVKNHPDNPCMGHRVGEGPYQWITYKEVQESYLSFGSGLVNLGIKPGSFVGIYSINRPQWVIAEQASNAFSNTVVPLYDTLGPDACKYIINQAKIEVIVLSAQKVPLMVKVLKDCPSVKFLISMDDVDQNSDDYKAADACKVKLIGFEDLIKDGKANKQDPVPPKPDTIATICYTSGTTGDPKGVMLSHGALIANVAGGIMSGVEMFENDIHISYLPLAHMYERLVQITAYGAGARVGFYRGDILKLFNDVGELKPTIFCSVPRLFNRLYDKVMGSVTAGGGVKKMMFDKAYAAKKANLQKNQFTHGLWDGLVFGKISAKLGGRVRLMVTGSAPISEEVKNFLHICFSCPIMEGYGQTECAAVATVTAITECAIGHVGGPVPCIEVKLVDVPDMNYLAADKPHPRGEVCFRGPSLFKGYYQNDAKTAEALDKDGWLHSGDIGLWLDDGSLKIIDRKKNIFKLAQGEYVAPEKIENIYARSGFVAQSFVYGDSLKACLVGVIVPDFDVLKPWAKQNGVDFADEKALVQDEKVKKAVLESIQKIGKEGGLKGFELVRDIFITHEPFSVENNILTPTFKLKRPQCKKFFQTQIDAMYQHLK